MAMKLDKNKIISEAIGSMNAQLDSHITLDYCEALSNKNTRVVMTVVYNKDYWPSYSQASVEVPWQLFERDIDDFKDSYIDTASFTNVANFTNIRDAELARTKVYSYIINFLTSPEAIPGAIRTTVYPLWLGPIPDVNNIDGMSKVEMVEAIGPALKKSKNIDFKITNVKDDGEWGVDYFMQWPNGEGSHYNWPQAWFNPNHDYSKYVKDHIKDFDGLPDAAKIIAKMMCYIYFYAKEFGYLK